MPEGRNQAAHDGVRSCDFWVLPERNKTPSHSTALAAHSVRACCCLCCVAVPWACSRVCHLLHSEAGAKIVPCGWGLHLPWPSSRERDRGNPAGMVARGLGRECAARGAAGASSGTGSNCVQVYNLPLSPPGALGPPRPPVQRKKGLVYSFSCHSREGAPRFSSKSRYPCDRQTDRPKPGRYAPLKGGSAKKGSAYIINSISSTSACLFLRLGTENVLHLRPGTAIGHSLSDWPFVGC